MVECTSAMALAILSRTEMFCGVNMARTYLIKGKLTRAQKEQGVNYVEHRRGAAPILAWTNTRQSMIIPTTVDVYKAIRKAFGKG